MSHSVTSGPFPDRVALEAAPHSALSVGSVGLTNKRLGVPLPRQTRLRESKRGVEEEVHCESPC